MRDQGHCGSCWVFAPAEAFSDRLCIASGGNFTAPLSAWQPTACAHRGGGGGCGGGDPVLAWSYAAGAGLATGGGYADVGTGASCLPYRLPSCAHHVNSSLPDCSTLGPEDSPPCPATWTCDAGYPTPFAKDTHRCGTPYQLQSTGDMKAEIAERGPITSLMSVREDFFSYKSGVYHHVTGDGVGLHSVKIIGWGKHGDVDYWLVANSWNSEWGMDGFFKIRFGDSDIDQTLLGSINAAKVSFK